MSADEPVARDPSPHAEAQDATMREAEESAAATTRSRPKLDLSLPLGSGPGKDRKRGRSMFGVLIGTLDKAKKEDKERNASEAAKKRQMIEQRLQAKLRKETDSVRRAEEAKKDKVTANRKEEDLQLKDSIQKLRRTRIPILANFLSTADTIPHDPDAPLQLSSKTLANPARSHPPPIFYLPAILTPAQQAFFDRRKAEVKDITDKEWAAFTEERSAGVSEIASLRQRVADEEAKRKVDARAAQSENGEKTSGIESGDAPPAASTMEVDEDAPPEESKENEAARKAREAVEREMKEDQIPADDDDAVEY